MKEKFEVINTGKTLEELAQQALTMLSELKQNAQKQKEAEEMYKPELVDIDVDSLQNHQRELAFFSRLQEMLAQSEVSLQEYEEIRQEFEGLAKLNSDAEGNSKDKNLAVLISIMRDELTSLYARVLDQDKSAQEYEDESKDNVGQV